jgi:hypothetical protein
MASDRSYIYTHRHNYPVHLLNAAEEISKREFCLLKADSVVNWWWLDTPRLLVFDEGALCEAVACARAEVEKGSLLGVKGGRLEPMTLVRKIRYDTDTDRVMVSVEVLPTREGLAMLEMVSHGISIGAFPAMNIYGGHESLWRGMAAYLVTKCRIHSVSIELVPCVESPEQRLAIYSISGVLRIESE